MDETFTDIEFDEAEHKLQNRVRITVHVEYSTTEVHTGTRWVPVHDYVVGLIGFIRQGGKT